MQTLKFVLCLRSLKSNKVCCLVTANADFKQTRMPCRYLQRRRENIPFNTESGSQKLRYRKFQGTVDIVATTGLHLKNTQVQVDVQKIAKQICCSKRKMQITKPSTVKNSIAHQRCRKMLKNLQRKQKKPTLLRGRKWFVFTLLR